LWRLLRNVQTWNFCSQKKDEGLGCPPITQKNLDKIGKEQSPIRKLYFDYNEIKGKTDVRLMASPKVSLQQRCYQG